ncbi:MAG: hypothetical protein QM691_11845 [Opitutaceae bacterium]
MLSLEHQRLDFISRSAGFRAFPLAGMTAWTAFGLASLLAPPATSIYLLLCATGAIFPLALGFAALTGQQVFQKGNAFASLIGQSVLMVNLIWVLHFALISERPALVPLSLAIGLGLHWIVFGWIIQSSLGLIHAIGRTGACTVAYCFGGELRMVAISAAVVVCYAFTLVRLQAWSRRAALTGAPGGLG